MRRDSFIVVVILILLVATILVIALPQRQQEIAKPGKGDVVPAQLVDRLRDGERKGFTRSRVEAEIGQPVSIERSGGELCAYYRAGRSTPAQQGPARVKSRENRYPRYQWQLCYNGQSAESRLVDKQYFTDDI